MIIAPHHVVGTKEHKLSSLVRPTPDYVPQCAWPDDCYVQWGHGLVPAVPFFEAFPSALCSASAMLSPSPRIKLPFTRYINEFRCNHLWGRNHPNPKGGLYTNGVGWCRKCGAFRSKMFPVIVVLGDWRKPLTLLEYDHMRCCEDDHELNEWMDQKYPDDREARLQRLRVLQMRYKLFGKIV